MYQPGHTITPNVTEDEYGNIVGLDFDIDRPQGYDTRYSPQDYYEDREGQTHHLFEDTELQEDGEYDVDDYEEQTVHLLHDLVGGGNAYQQMITWAAQNLDPSDCEAFDELVDQAVGTGEYGEIEEAVQQLYQMFVEAGGQQYQQQQDSEEDEGWYEDDDDDDEPTEMQSVVYNAVGGQDNYLAMLHWGFEYLTEDQIDWYDDCIDSGDPDLISEAVGSLYELYMENA